MHAARVDTAILMIRPLRACALACVFASACGPKDEETTTTATESASTAGPTTGGTQGESTMAGTAASSGASPSTGELPPVECDGVTCAAGQLCLWPPSVCDYNQNPPQVTRGGKMCADFPANCDSMSMGLAMCLSEALCTGSVLHEGATYEMGLLDCFPAWNDCF